MGGTVQAQLPTLSELGSGLSNTAKNVAGSTGQLLDTAIDLGVGAATLGYTFTDVGKEDLNKVKRKTKESGKLLSKNLEQFGQDITGQTAVAKSYTERVKAAEDQAQRERDIADMNLRKKRVGEFASTRVRQRALMGQFSGRAGTILTGSGSDNTTTLGSSGAGKTLLGS